MHNVSLIANAVIFFFEIEKSCSDRIQASHNGPSECVGLFSFICMEKGSFLCETEAVGYLKTEEFGGQKRRASTGHLVIVHLDGRSLFESAISLLQTHALTKSCLCVSSSLFIR